MSVLTVKGVLPGREKALGEGRDERNGLSFRLGQLRRRLPPRSWRQNQAQLRVTGNIAQLGVSAGAPDVVEGAAVSIPDLLHQLLVAPRALRLGGARDRRLARRRGSVRRGLGRHARLELRRVSGRGGGTVSALVGHIDEIGVIATHVNDEGFISIRRIGGFSAEPLVGQRVEFLSGVKGLVARRRDSAARPSERKAADIKELHVDIGARDGAEARSLVQPGDAAVLGAEPAELPTAASSRVRSTTGSAHTSRSSPHGGRRRRARQVTSSRSPRPRRRSAVTARAPRSSRSSPISRWSSTSRRRATRPAPIRAMTEHTPWAAAPRSSAVPYCIRDSSSSSSRRRTRKGSRTRSRSPAGIRAPTPTTRTSAAAACPRPSSRCRCATCIRRASWPSSPTSRTRSGSPSLPAAARARPEPRAVAFEACPPP